MTELKPKRSWFGDRLDGVPLGTVFAIAVQFAVLVWLLSQNSSQTDRNTARIDKLEAQQIAMRVESRMATLEAQIVDIKFFLIRIENKIDAIQRREITK